MLRPARDLTSAMVAIATISCATASPKKSDPRIAEREVRTRALVAEVSKARGLAETNPLDISFEDAATFHASLARAAAEDQSDPEVEKAKWVAFGFATPDVDPQEIARKVLDEQVAAFYDPHEKKLHVPLDAPEGLGAQADQAAEVILAHEIEHGLQDQHFPIPELDRQPNDDIALALKAIYEGDATFVMIEVPLARQGPVDGARLLTIARQLRALPMSALESMSGKQSPELEKAPKLVRDELLLPYFGGMLLVAELYRVGGFPLVDQLFQHPPESSAQVLHPEKYLAGERPSPIGPLALPAGMKELARGRLGELGTRTMFSDCLSDDESAKGAEGWRNDEYLIAVKPDGAMALLWTTSWDDEAAAQRFEAAMERAGSRCFPGVLSTAKTSWTLPAGAHVERRGDLVSAVRGLSPAEETAAFAMMEAVPHGAKISEPPLGDVHLAPPEAASGSPATSADASAHSPQGLMPPHPPGVVENGIWRSGWNGLRAAIPEGFVLTEGPGELTMKKGGMNAGQLVAVPSPSTPEVRGLMVGMVVAGLSRALGGRVDVKSGAPREMTIDGTPAIEIPIGAAGAPFEMKMTFWPRCDGRVLYVITTSSGERAAGEQLARWVSSLKSEDPNAPVCQLPAVSK